MRTWRLAFAAPIMIMAVAACGGGGGAGGGGTTTPDPPPAAADPATTITIGAAGVSPKEITVSVGGRATFVNRNNAFHEMSSDPHPTHGDCPEINAVGALGPGASRQTAPFTRARVCTYHDHGQETNTALHGRIVVR